MLDILNQDIQYLPGVGPKKRDMLQKELGISKISDLLEYYPYKYVDRSRIYTINELRDKTGIPIRVVNDLMYKLVEARLAIEITSDEKGEPSRFVPAFSVEKLTLGIMIDRIESLGRWQLEWHRQSLEKSQWLKAISIRSNYLKQSRELLLKDFCV